MDEDINDDRYRITLLLVLVGILFSVTVSTGLNFAPIPDERNFHLPTIRLFYDHLVLAGDFMQAIRNMNVANGPAPYVLFSAVAEATNFDVASLRLLSVFMSFGAVCYMYRLGRKLELPLSLEGSLLLLFFPYYFVYGFTLLVHSFALFGCLGGLFYYFEYITKRNIASVTLSVILLSLAVASRQTYIVVPIIIGMWVCFSAISKRQFPNVLDLLPSVLPILALLTILAVWGGLVPPKFQDYHKISPSIEALNLALIFPSVYLFPVFPLVLGHKKILLFSLVLVLALVLLNLVLTSFPYAISASKGIVPLAFEIISKRSPGLAVFGQVLAAFIGISITMFLFTMQPTKFHLFIAMNLLAAVLASLITSYDYELYLVQAIPWFILLSLSHFVEKRIQLFVWLIYYAGMASIYFLLKIVLLL